MQGLPVKQRACSAGTAAADFPKSGSARATGYETMVVADGLDGWDTGVQPDIFVMAAVIR
jgi:hypothetical protein